MKLNEEKKVYVEPQIVMFGVSPKTQLQAYSLKHTIS